MKNGKKFSHQQTSYPIGIQARVQVSAFERALLERNTGTRKYIRERRFVGNKSQAPAVKVLRNGSHFFVERNCVLLIAEAVISILLDKISQSVGSELDIRIKEQNELINYLKDRRSDIAIILEQSLDSSLLVKKLFDYELILVSNKKIAESVKPEELIKFKFIKDRTRTYLDDILHKHGVDAHALDVAYSLDGSIMVCRALASNHADTYVAFLPRFLIENEGAKQEGGIINPQNIVLDELYDEAKAIVLEEEKTSISYLQRRLRIGYNRAATIIEQLEQMGVLSEINAKGQRDIIK